MTLACWIWTIWTMLTTAAFLGYLPHFLSPEIWPSNVELSFYQVHCSCQNLPAFPLCQKNWFCGKVCLDGFYPLLRSKSSSWIHIVIKRIFQACCPHHLKNMEKIVKHNFGGAGGGRRVLGSTSRIWKFPEVWSYFWTMSQNPITLMGIQIIYTAKLYWIALWILRCTCKKFPSCRPKK